jgi:multidrug efflux pump subunit AcrB
MARADLKNPYVIVAISLIIVIFGGAPYRKMAVDIVPEINPPVVAAVAF